MDFSALLVLTITSLSIDCPCPAAQTPGGFTSLSKESKHLIPLELWQSTTGTAFNKAQAGLQNPKVVPDLQSFLLILIRNFDSLSVETVSFGIRVGDGEVINL